MTANPTALKTGSILALALTGRIKAQTTEKPDLSSTFVPMGQTIDLHSGRYNCFYFLAESVNGDQRAEFENDARRTEMNFEDWCGFSVQWDDSEWLGQDVSHDKSDFITGLKPGFIKRAYSCSYLLGYVIDLVAGATTGKLPDNENMRILAISVAEDNPSVTPARPIYDVLSASSTGEVSHAY
jgi:alpha-mannosidase